jgi:hypothetical protein
MKKLEYWFQKNNLITNSETTLAMSFHTKQSRFPIRPKITFRNMDIAYKSESNVLGILITKNLKWIAHVRSLSLKTEKSILPGIGNYEFLYDKVYLSFQISIMIKIWYNFGGAR